MMGLNGGPSGPQSGEFKGRGSAQRAGLVKSEGGNSASEAAVARGLAWLATQIRYPDKAEKIGYWQYDGSHRSDRAAATGMALLPFLAAGQTHKNPSDPAKKAENKYQKVVAAGIAFLLAQQGPDGAFYNGRENGQLKDKCGMYAQAVATVALCELYGMTGDKKGLQGPAQKAISFILSCQGANGSWGYTPNTDGDTSIVGWQIQALHSAKLCKDIVVDKARLDRAKNFLSTVTAPGKPWVFGYTDRSRFSPALSSVGLLCRYYVDGWSPQKPEMAGGVKYLMDSQRPDPAKMEIYYYYYATQVLHFYGGPEWEAWNGPPASTAPTGMRNILVRLQQTDGSWAQGGDLTAGAVGKLGTSCLSLLTLEVYYRHLPTYKRDAAALRD